jgi:hypothetical protein
MADKQYPMGVAVTGMMRSGTTLIADLLTVRGRSLVISEPNLLGNWNVGQTRRTHAIAQEFGLEVKAPPPPGTYARNDEYFRAAILPALRKLDWWGVKYVDLHGIDGVFRRYPPKRLVLCVRDIRDATISAIELVERMTLGFDDHKHLRDEAWVFSRLAYTIHELMALRRHPHLVVRYEDLATRPDALKEELRAYMEMDALGDERINLMIEDPSRKQWEAEKHAEGITARSLGRFEREPAGPARRLAERLWRLFPEYSLAFDYEVPRPAERVAAHPYRLRVRPGDNPIEYIPTENALWPGPDCLEPSFALRRARRLVARNLRPGEAVLELGHALPALRYMKPDGTRFTIQPREVRRFDAIARGELPPIGRATVIAATDLLEYLPDLNIFLKALRRLGKPVLITYHAVEDTKGVDRAALGWVNHLTRRQLTNRLNAAGFRVTAKWDIKQGISLIRARPAAPVSQPASQAAEA